MLLDTSSSPTPLRSVLLAAALIVLAGVLAYANSFDGAFAFDDFPAIRDNETLRHLWPPWRALSPPSDTGVGGRPLANLSFALNYAFGGTAVRGYHAVNLLLHLGSALLLFGIVRRTLTSLSISCPRSPVSCLWLAGGVASLWVAHPLTTAAVTWLSQRTELLMAFCYLATLYAFVRGSRSPHPRWLIVSAVACVLGMLSKEVMATAPLVVLLYDRAFVAGTFRAAWNARRTYYLGLAASWLVLAWTLTTGLSHRSVGFGLGVSPWGYAVAEFRAVLTYLKLALWPSPLVFDYGALYPPFGFGTTAAIAVVVSLLATTWIGLRRNAAWGFVGATFFLLLAPTSTFVPIAEQPIAENRAYLPLAAVLALGVIGLRAGIRPRIWIIALPPLIGLTLARNITYRSELSLWSETTRQRPANPRAHYNRGIVLLDLGRASDAIPCFARAIELKPGEAKAHHSLGNALLELGRPAESLAHYAEAVRLDPHYARAWCNYGTALLRTGDAAGAIARFDQATRLMPGDATTAQGLGNAYFQLDDPARALAHYETALRLDPTLADVHYSCGNACVELQRFDDAIAHFAAASRLKPEDAEIHNNFGAALLRAGRIVEAIAEFETALRLQRDYADARDNLAVARAEFARRSAP